MPRRVSSILDDYSFTASFQNLNKCLYILFHLTLQNDNYKFKQNVNHHIVLLIEYMIFKNKLLDFLFKSRSHTGLNQSQNLKIILKKQKDSDQVQHVEKSQCYF